MIIDSSALLAIFFEEEDAARFATRCAEPIRKRMSAATYLECAIKLDNNSGGAPVELDEYLELAGVEVVPVTPAQARIARRAHQRFGKGRHPAALSFGDCFVYALAVETGEPLLFKGDDFTLTDLPGVAP